MSFARCFSPGQREEEQMRAIGLDVHLEFCEVAIWERGELRSAGRIETKPEQIELFARSLGGEDRVALEVTGNAWEIKRLIEPHVGEVIVVSPNDTGIRSARAKTDRLDARALARLLASGELDSVWVPDRPTKVIRRRLQRRTQLVRARTRAKNEVHAVLMRCLVGPPPSTDLFGAKGRRWLADLALPEEERETLDSALRQIEFLDSEIEAVERPIAAEALKSPEAKRLMTVPGVNVICAASFLAAIGEVGRFESSRKLVGYLGLDPRVSQSGSAPAAHGRISKQGSVSARHALVEASWSVIRQPGPIRAFYERIRARRGHQVAVVAAARKLACLLWCLLAREEDYAYAQPSLTARKLRRLELAAGAESRRGRKSGLPAKAAMREAERQLAAQAEAAYRRTVADWQAKGRKGAGATPGRASRGPSSGQAARQVQAPGPAL
jgi:transposase